MDSEELSTSLFSSLDQLDVRSGTSAQTFDFSTLNISIPHNLLKSRISYLLHNDFRRKGESVRYTHINVTRSKGYFTHDINGGGDNICTANNIRRMTEFSNYNIFVQFRGCLFRQVTCWSFPLLAWEWISRQCDQKWPQEICRSFILCCRYTNGLIVFNNKKFLDYLKEIYPS